MSIKPTVHFQLDLDLYNKLKDQAKTLDKSLSEHLRVGLKKISDDLEIHTRQLKEIKALKDRTENACEEYFRSELDSILESNQKADLKEQH